MSEIGISIDGQDYEGWDTLTVNRNINAVCGDFSFTLADFPLQDTAAINPGQESEVFLREDNIKTKLITGYIDSVSREKEGDSTSLSFTGRDKTSDLVDCAAIHKSNTWRRSGVAEIVIDICRPFGIDVILDNPAAAQPVDKFTIQNGETSFAAIDRLCRAYGIWPTTNSD